MRWNAKLVAACAALSLPLLPAFAHAASNEELIRGWYRDYLGRPVGPELQAWTQLLDRGLSPIDVQATILGSDEFYAQKGRDPQTYVMETLQSVTWSQPTASELNRWTTRLTALRGDRLALAREILYAYSQPAGAGISSGAPAAANAAEVAGRLLSASKLLSDTLDFEIAGTQQGRQANLQAQSLYESADQLKRIVAIRTYRPDDAAYALQDCQRSFAALQSTLSNPPGTAPSSANIARRVSSILSEAQLALRPTSNTPSYPGTPTYPTYPPVGIPLPGTAPLPAAVGYDQQQFLAAADSVARGVESLIQSFKGPAYQNYNYSVVLRDLDTFATRVDDLKNSIRRGASAERLQWELQSLSEQAQRLEPQLLAGRPPQFTRLFWSSVASGLAQMQEPLLAAAGNTGVVGPGGSTVLRPTPVSPELLPLLDQALSRTDVFLTGTQPLVFGIPELPRVQMDVRNLKTRLLTMRQETQDGQPASLLKATLDSMVTAYQSAYTRWGQIVTSYRLVNPPRLSPLGETLNQVEQVLVRAVADEGLTPATGSVSSSHIARLITTLGTELRQVRELLPSFTNYPEHRSLLVYCDQLDDYLATITEAQRNPATGPEVLRRQAAGMQRVVGLLLANADSLASRVQAAGTREQRTVALNLQSEVLRLSGLVDDLESELH
jgi:hypothetical protein